MKNNTLSDKIKLPYSNYTFLVTGGAGFIGSHITEYLVQQNASVIVIDNLSNGNKNNLSAVLDKIEFIPSDINDSAVLDKILSKVDFIFHLAALGSVNRSIADPLSTHHANSTGFLNILHHAHLHNIKGIVYSSSSSVYGDDTTLPKVEDKIGRPLSPYAVSKLSNEWYASVFWKLHQLPVIGLRYFNVFGPRQNPHGAYAAAIPLFIHKMLNNDAIYIHGNGNQKRDFTYVENVVNANMLALQSIINKQHDALGKVFNIGCQQNFSINEIFNILSEKLSYQKKPIYTEPRKGDIFESLADISQAQKILHYQPTIYFNEGIDKTLQALKIQSS